MGLFGTRSSSEQEVPQLVRVKVFGHGNPVVLVREETFMDDDSFWWNGASISGTNSSSKRIAITGLGGTFFATIERL